MYLHVTCPLKVQVREFSGSKGGGGGGGGAYVGAGLLLYGSFNNTIGIIAAVLYGMYLHVPSPPIGFPHRYLPRLLNGGRGGSTNHDPAVSSFAVWKKLGWRSFAGM